MNNGYTVAEAQHLARVGAHAVNGIFPGLFKFERISMAGSSANGRPGTGPGTPIPVGGAGKRAGLVRISSRSNDAYRLCPGAGFAHYFQRGFDDASRNFIELHGIC